MGTQASTDRLTKFYAPVFLVSFVVSYFLSSNQPASLSSLPMPNMLKAWYQATPVKFGLVLASAVTAGAMLYNQDIAFTGGGGGTAYYAELLPKEYYGNNQPAGLRESRLGPVGFKNNFG